jgi:hypothetical protein
MEVLQNFVNQPRLSVPVPAPTGRPKTAQKLGQARSSGGSGAGSSKAGAGTGGLPVVESESQATWDEDEVMLFFFGETRRQQKNIRRKLVRSFGLILLYVY